MMSGQKQGREEAINVKIFSIPPVKEKNLPIKFPIAVNNLVTCVTAEYVTPLILTHVFALLCSLS